MFTIAGVATLVLALAVIFGAAWAICWVLRTYAKAVPAEVQTFVYLIAAIIAIIKIAMWAGI
jgi:hypothetical protein